MLPMTVKRLYAPNATLTNSRPWMTLRSSLIALSALLISCIFFPPKDSNNWIKDKDGRIAIYHGVNISNYAKVSNNGRAGISWHTREDYARLKDWGFNLVRYLVFWEAVEPVEGQIDTSYLNMTAERIGWLRDMGIDVLIDIHQDLYAQRFSGNGFPDWMVFTNKSFEPHENWMINYLEPAVMESYGNFWKSSENQAKYRDMVKLVLSKVRMFDNVVGVDVMNEPFPGYTKEFESRVLSNFYGLLEDMFYGTGTDKYMAYEPWISTSAGLPATLTFKPSMVRGIYAPHYYDPVCHDGGPYKWENKKLMENSMALRVSEAAKVKVPLIYGEFGIGPQSDKYQDYIKDFVNLCDRYCVGWLWWSYDKTIHSPFGLIDEDGKETPTVKVLSRVYPQRIGGTKPKYGIEGNVFTLTYEGNKGMTEIFVPMDSVVIAINVPHTWTREGHIVKCSTEGRTEVRITWE